MAKLSIDPNAPAVQPAAPQTVITQQIDGQAPVDAGAETATEKHSPKHKASRGVPEDWVTTWVPFDMSKEDNERLRKVAAVRKQKIGELLQSVLKWGLEGHKEAFDADAAAYVEPERKPRAGASIKKIDEMSPEEAMKFAQSAEERAKAAVEKAKQLLAAARARAAGQAS